MAQAVFGGGCFWCTEAVFSMLKGVSAVESGYAGGTDDDPTYERVSSGVTGHAEVIRVTYDPAIVTYRDLLTVFFGSHDPTTLDRQGADTGTQYRSVIFYGDPQEREIAQAMIAEIDASLTGSKVVTQLVPSVPFHPAETYHKNYYAQNPAQPYCQLVIQPKIEKVRKRFGELLA